MRSSPTLSIRGDGGIVKFSLGGGVVVPNGLAQMCADQARALDGEVPSVILADMRMPVWAVTESQMTALYAGVDPAGIAPAALVVTPEHYRLFKAHAWAVAQAGIMRKVFTDYDSAQEWCRMWLRLAGHQRTAP